jgi:menaquinone-dependent protoporphyrinogen oxidase
MDFKRLSFLDRLIAKMVGAIEEDRRDWGAIKQWARTVEVG